MPTAERIAIPVESEHAYGVLHAIASASGSGSASDTIPGLGSVLMVAGAGGGLLGPSGVYEDLALRLAQDGIVALRLEYRRPTFLADCVADVQSAIADLRGRGSTPVALIGWSFGGAVVIAAGAASTEVVGVATIASQTYGTAAVRFLAPKPLLLIHGTHDVVLPDLCSRMLYAEAHEPKELVLYAGDGHGIEQHRAELLDKLFAWSRNVLTAVPPAAF